MVTEWMLPQEPGPEVKAVAVADTDVIWHRLDPQGPLAGYWCVDKAMTAPPPQVLDWPGLLAHAKHVVDATGQQ
jgi:hypothetical protein